MSIRTYDYNHDVTISDWLRVFNYGTEVVMCEEHDIEASDYVEREVPDSEWEKVAYNLAHQLLEQSIQIKKLEDRLNTLAKRISWETEP